MRGVLVIAEARANIAAIAADLDRGRAALGVAAGGLNLGRAAAYLRAAIQELEIAEGKGVRAVEVAA